MMMKRRIFSAAMVAGAAAPLAVHAWQGRKRSRNEVS